MARLSKEARRDVDQRIKRLQQVNAADSERMDDEDDEDDEDDGWTMEQIEERWG